MAERKDPVEIKQSVLLFCRLVRSIEIDDLALYLSELDTWDTIGPMFHYADWQANRQQVGLDRAIFTKLLELRRLLETVPAHPEILADARLRKKLKRQARLEEPNRTKTP